MFRLLLLAATCLPLIAQAPIRATTEDGRRVVLAPDGTWKFEPATRVASPPAGPVRTKSLLARTKAAIPFGDSVLWYNDTKWKPISSNEDRRMLFGHTNGKLYGMVLSEALGGVSTTTMRDVALINARQLDPQAAVSREERRTVNGREFLYLELDAANKGIQFHFMGYYHGGVKTNLQVVAYTLKSQFDENRAELEEFINGIELREASAPETAPPAASAPPEGVLNYGAFSLRFDPAKWRASHIGEAGTWELAYKPGEAYAKMIAEKAEIPLETLVELAARNMREQDSQARLIADEDRTYSGVRIKVVKVELAPKGIPLTFLCYYYGGPGGAVQLLTWAGRQQFAAQEPALRELLNGLVIRAPEK
jgi:hypothetical protein